MTTTVRGISVERRDASIDNGYQREYTVTYFVHTDDWHDGPQTVLDATGIPKLGDEYVVGNDIDTNAIVHGKQVSQRDAPDEWEVVVSYKTRGTGEGGGGGGDDDATLEPTKISLSNQNRNIVIPGRFQEPLNARIDAPFDMGVHMSNGEHCDPPPEIDISEPVLTISRNVRNLDIAYSMGVINSVNSEPFFGCEPRQLKLCNIRAESVSDRIGNYWRLTFDLAFRYETWDVQICNRGHFYLGENANYPGVAVRKAFKDEEGHPFIGLLTIDGKAINDDGLGYLGIYVDGGESPSFQRFRVYREIDFNQIGIF